MKPHRALTSWPGGCWAQGQWKSTKSWFGPKGLGFSPLLFDCIEDLVFFFFPLFLSPLLSFPAKSRWTWGYLKSWTSQTWFYKQNKYESAEVNYSLRKQCSCVHNWHLTKWCSKIAERFSEEDERKKEHVIWSFKKSEYLRCTIYYAHLDIEINILYIIIYTSKLQNYSEYSRV